MALHHIAPTQIVNGERFEIIQDFDRVRLCSRRRHLVNGRPVTAAVFAARLADAKAVEQVKKETGA